MPAIQASPALAKLRILDLTRVRAGPTCVRQFADFGAVQKALEDRGITPISAEQVYIPTTTNDLPEDKAKEVLEKKEKALMKLAMG